MHLGFCCRSEFLSVGVPALSARAAQGSGRAARKLVTVAAGRTRAPVLESVDEPALYRYAHALKKAHSSSNSSSSSPVALPGRQPSQKPTRKHSVQKSALTDIQLSPQQPDTQANDEQTTSSTGFPQALLRLLPKWTPRVRGLVLLNLLVLLVATNWVVLRDTETFFDAFDFAALRFTIAAAAFSPFLSKAIKDKKIVQAGAELGAWSALGYLTQAQGLLTSDASRASFISTFTVLVVPLLSGLSGKGIRRTTIISGAVALVGVGLLESGGSASFDTGDLWNFASAIAFGIQVFRTEHHSRQLPQKSSLQLMSVLLLTIAAISVGAAGLKHPSDVAAFLGNPGQFLSHVHPANLPWKQVLYTGLLSTDVALWLEVIALQDVSSVEAAIIYTLEPVLGAAFAYLLLGERWGPAGWCGAALIVLSSLATQIWGSPDSEIAETAKQITAGASDQVSKAAQSLSESFQSDDSSRKGPSQ